MSVAGVQRSLQGRRSSSSIRTASGVSTTPSGGSALHGGPMTREVRSSGRSATDGGDSHTTDKRVDRWHTNGKRTKSSGTNRRKRNVWRRDRNRTGSLTVPKTVTCTDSDRVMRMRHDRSSRKGFTFFRDRRLVDDSDTKRRPLVSVLRQVVHS